MMNEELPPLEERKKLLEERRSQLRRAAFSAEMDLVSVKAQKVKSVEEKDKAKMLVDLRETADNAYAGASEMTRLLKELEES